MHIRHLHLHRRDEGLFGFGNIAHEIDGASDTKKRHVEKREPQAIKTVFKTLEATFEGKIGGYKTVVIGAKPTDAEDKAPAVTQRPSNDDEEEDDDEDQKKEAEEKKKQEQEEAEEEAAKKKAQEEAKKEAQEEAKKEAEEEAKKEAQEEAAKEKQKEKEEQAKKEAAAEKTRSKTKDDEDEESTTAKPTRTRLQTTSDDPSSIPSVISNPTETQSIESVLAKATGGASASTPIDPAADMSGTSTLSGSSETAEASSSGGTTAGTKAGIAFGVLGGLLAVGLLVFFIFSKRRKQAEMERLENDDEKLNGPIGGGRGMDNGMSGMNTMGATGTTGAMGAVVATRAVTPEVDETASIRTAAKAPRVSLRPVTQFLPNWNGLENQKRTSKGAAMTLAVPAAASAATATGPLSPRTPGGSVWERPSTAQSADSANPFGHQAERVATPVQDDTQARNLPASPASQKSTIAVVAAAAIPAASAPVSPGGSVSPQSPANDPFTANGPPVSAGAALLARKTSMRKDSPKAIDLTLPNPPLATVPASPAGTEFSTSSAAPGAPEAASSGAAAIAAAGGPVNSAVHRVQLDFKPTLDDELELKAGDLVRLLHEYDDGWAQCIRLDRSRQGVVPRTCLSTRPVKPRPAQSGPRSGPPVKPVGPPRGPGPNHPQGQRPMTPQGNFGQGRPASPAGRPMTPNGSPQSPMGPPMGAPGRPAGPPMSPGPRSQSPGPRQGPPGGRPMSPGPRSQSPGPAGGRSQSPSG
ncbi:variant sh3, partial [Fusarium albosuccineum]